MSKKIRYSKNIIQQAIKLHKQGFSTRVIMAETGIEDYRQVYHFLKHDKKKSAMRERYYKLRKVTNPYKIK